MIKQVTAGLIIILALLTSARAQFQLSGRVVDAKKNQPVSYVSVILQAGDEIIDGAIALENGSFEISGIKSGTYTFLVRMLGYDTYQEDSLVIESDLNLGSILLHEASQTLDEVLIRAPRSLLESQLGKRVLNIGEDLAGSGSTVVDALDQVPSVTTDIDGNVSIRGSSNIVIYVDGKETQRDSRSLQNIPASALQQIEVITNPGAKFDAEGVGGIINLIYRKSRFNKKELELVLSGAVPSRLGAGFNSSLSSKRVSLYLNANESRAWYENSNDQIRRNFNDSLSRYENLIAGEGLGSYRNITSGLTFEPDSTWSLNVEFNYWRWDDDEVQTRENNFYFSQSPAEFYQVSNSTLEIEDELSLSITIDKKWKNDQSLQLYFSGSGEDESNSAAFNIDNLDLAGTPLIQNVRTSEETESQRLYQLKLDYTTPTWNWGGLELGAKFDWIRYDIDQNLDFSNDSLFLPRNLFAVDLNKGAGYLVYSRKFSQLELGVGVRLEHFSSDFSQKLSNTSFRQSFTNLFPSVQILYKFSNLGSISTSYSKRISRPGFFDLNPFVSFTDPLILSTGNPFLEPEFADAIELTLSHTFGPLNIDLTGFHRQTRNVIQRTVEPFDQNRLLLSYENFGKRLNRGVEGSLSIDVGDKLDFSGNWSLYHTRFTDLSQSDNVQFNDQLTWQGRLQQRFEFGRNWALETTEYYRAPRINTQSEDARQYYVNLGLRKQLKEKRGTITLGLTDVFNTRVFGSRVLSNEFEITQEFKFQTRRLSLQLRYKLW